MARTTELFQPFLATIMVIIMVLVLLSSYGYQFHHKNANSTNIYIWVHFIEGAKGQYFVPDERSPSNAYLYFVNVIILNNLFWMPCYCTFVAGENKSSTRLHHSMTSSTQALSLLYGMLACLLAQYPSKFSPPVRTQFKVIKMKCPFCTSKRALKLSLSTLRSGKISRLYSLTSSGFLHLRAHSSFCLVLLYFLRIMFHQSQQGSLWRNILTQTPLSVSLCIPCSWH